MVGRGLHRVDERAPGEAAVPRPRAAARARAPGLLRPHGSERRRGAVRARAIARRARLLLLLLLVQRQAPARTSARGDGRAGDARFPVLRVLGERELDAPLGRPGQRRADGAALRPGRQRAPVRRVRATVPRPALHPRRRPPAPPRLQDDADPELARDGRSLAAQVRPGRRRRSVSRLLRDRWPRGRARRRLRRTGRVPAAPASRDLAQRRRRRAGSRVRGRAHELPVAGDPVAAAFGRPRAPAALRVPIVGQHAAAAHPRDRVPGVEPGAVRLLGGGDGPRHPRALRRRRAVHVRERLERVGRGLLSRAGPRATARSTSARCALGSSAARGLQTRSPGCRAGRPRRGAPSVSDVAG